MKGVCGKPEETADLQDLLIYVSKGVSVFGEKLKQQGTVDKDAAHFVCKALFSTITNVAWNNDVIRSCSNDRRALLLPIEELVDMTSPIFPRSSRYTCSWPAV